MKSVYAIYDGESFVTSEKIELKKGQKVVLTILEDEINSSEESSYLYNTAIKSGAFDFLLEEGEHEYTIDDCKIKYK